MDKFYLQSTLPALDPSQLNDLKYLGVNEVARAKGHDYMTVIYDMESGHLIGVETGRSADVLADFLQRLSLKTAVKIGAVSEFIKFIPRLRIYLDTSIFCYASLSRIR